MSFDSRPFLKSLTDRPGVYQMLGDKGEVLYVGKAKNLRKRVASYFRGSGQSTKTQAMVARIERIEVTVTGSEVEALLLEQNLIKEYRPKFNILLRDDKSYPYIFLSEGEDFPRLAFHRGARRSRGSYFGPFPSVSAVRETLAFLQKTFQVRPCEDSVFRNRSRPCLQYQIKRCTGPCVGLIDREEYARDVQHIRWFLEGKSDALMRDLERRMEDCSRRFDYEQAAVFRDRIASLRAIQAEQVIESGRGNIDVVAAALKDNQTCVHVLFVRQGRILGSRSYYPGLPVSGEVEALLTEFLAQFYLSSRRGDYPAEIVISETLADAGLLGEAIGERAGRRVRIAASVRAARARWLELARRTAQQNLVGRLTAQQNILKQFESLRQMLRLEEAPERLECFDISHSSGEATVASCVVFGREGPVKADYRRFNIADIAPGDDYAAIEQALRRRYLSLQKGKGKLPDVLFIDGGKGQTGRARQVMSELGVVGVCLVGVAKGPTRKAGWETLVVCEGEALRELTPTQGPGLHLIQQVRDEAHRFAITGHKQRRDRKRRTSLLEDIPGVGAKRRRELLKYFGGAREVQQATVNDLAKVPSISKKLAETIYTELHSG